MPCPISILGDDLGSEEDMTYDGTVVGIDGCVYGITYFSSLIIRYNPINDIMSVVGEEIDWYFLCTGNGALGRDGCIYAFAENARALKIDTINNSHEFVGNRTSTELSAMMQSWELMTVSIGHHIVLKLL